MTVLDFAASLPSPEAIKNKGHEGVMLYCSPPRANWMRAKQPSRSYLDGLDRNGIKFGFVWQYRGGSIGLRSSDVGRGYEGGVADAKEAQKYLNSVRCGGHPVFFAVDFDCLLGEWNSVVSKYFQGAISVLGKQRVGIYGHSKVVAWAQEDDLVASLGNGRVLGWVTRSWSANEKAQDYAVLYQGVHNVTGPDGVQVDINDVYVTDWGWRSLPTGSTPPPPLVKTKMVPKKGFENLKPNPGHRGDPHWLPMLLKAFGVPVKLMPGWDQWGMGDFDKIWGVGNHHTGSNNTSESYIARNPRLGNGLSAQIHLSRTAPYYATLCGVGIAWHMGKGSYPGLPTNNANPFLIGIEAQSDGVSRWPEGMLDIYYRINAAILWYLGLPVSHAISHWEYSMAAQGKWDPGAGDGVSGHVMNMDHFRSRVQHYIDNPPFLEGVTEMTNPLDEKHSSRYPGSTYTGTLRDFILNTDAHSFASRVNTEKLLLIAQENNKILKSLERRVNNLENQNATS